MSAISGSKAFDCGSLRGILLMAVAVFFSVLPAPGQNQLPDGNGKETVQRVCGTCHGMGFVTNRGMARKDWDWTLQRMIGYSAPIPKEEIPVLLDYLTANFPGEPRPAGVAIPGSTEVSIKEWAIPTKGSRVRDPLVAPDVAQPLGQISPGRGPA